MKGKETVHSEKVAEFVALRGYYVLTFLMSMR